MIGQVPSFHLTFTSKTTITIPPPPLPSEAWGNFGKNQTPHLEQQVVEVVVLITHDWARLEDGGIRVSRTHSSLASSLGPHAATGVVS
jgi:hypothetical protein